MNKSDPPKEIELSPENLHLWPSYQKLYDDGKIMADQKGTLRYPHGAPVGKLILIRINKAGEPVYKESAAGLSGSNHSIMDMLRISFTSLRNWGQ